MKKIFETSKFNALKQWNLTIYLEFAQSPNIQIKVSRVQETFKILKTSFLVDKKSEKLKKQSFLLARKLLQEKK